MPEWSLQIVDLLGKSDLLKVRLVAIQQWQILIRLSNSQENLQLDPSAARGAQGRRAIRKDHCPGSVIQRVLADISRKKQVLSKGKNGLWLYA